MKRNAPLPFIWSVIKPYKYFYLMMMIAPVASGVYPIMYNYAVKLLIDLFTQREYITLENSWKPIALFIGAQVTLDGAWRMHNFAQLRSIPYIFKDMMNKICEHCFKLPYVFFQNNLSGSVSGRMKGIGDSFFKIHNALELQFTKPLLITLFAGITLSAINVKIFLFVLVFTLIYSPIAIKVFIKISKMEKQNHDSWYVLFGSIVDRVVNIFTIFSFATEKRELKRISQYYDKVHNPLVVKYYKYDFISSIVLCLFYWVFLIALFCYVIYMKNNNEISVGDIAFVMSLSLLFTENSWEATMNLKFFLETIAAFRSAFTLMQTPQDTLDKPNAPQLIIQKGEIVFKNATFSYDSTNTIFTNLDLRIEGGQKIAIVGYSGAGKSTLLSLLAKNFKISNGDIMIDNQSIYDVSSHSLRNQIAYIPQEIVLFHRSIGENIGYAKESPTQAEIERAARAANLHDFILTLPDKYDTLVGERGLKLSGGQRQRIAIARAILKNAPILVLDEATSSLDTQTELEIQQSITDLLKNNHATVIVVAHRLSTIRHLDRIIVIENGQIVEDGKFAELLERENGRFKHLWKIQTENLLL